MKGLREFEIPYVGLKVGVHRFKYDIDADFFKHFKDSPINDCKVTVNLDFEKKETFFILNFFIDGDVHVECDRCLAPFRKAIFGDYTCYVKFADEPNKMDEEPDVMYISRDESIIDISHLVYEYVILCLPMQQIGCEKPGQEPQCNQETLKFLNNDTTTENNESDPRWDVLKKLKN